MQVSLETNNYLQLQSYQRTKENPSILPIQNPIEEELSPEEKLNLQKELEAVQTQKEQEEQAQKDALRGFVVDYVGVQSKKTQAEIYLSGMLENDVDLTNDVTLLESLRDVKKQNDFINGYATYKELQDKIDNIFTA